MYLKKRIKIAVYYEKCIIRTFTEKYYYVNNKTTN